MTIVGHALSEAAIAENWGRTAQASNPVACAMTHPCASRETSVAKSVLDLASLDVQLHKDMSYFPRVSVIIMYSMGNFFRVYNQ